MLVARSSLIYFKWTRLVGQTLGILLIINVLLILTELPFTLSFLYRGSLSYKSLCPVWILINYTLFILSIILIAWTAIERYLFIYHDHFMKRHRFLVHYAPIGLFIVYTPMFYVGLVIIYPCEQAYDVRSFICGGPCYLLYSLPTFIDWSFNVIFTLLVTCFFNVLLIVCNVLQRQRMKRAIITAGTSSQWVSQRHDEHRLSCICPLASIDTLECATIFHLFAVRHRMGAVRHCIDVGHVRQSSHPRLPAENLLLLLSVHANHVSAVHVSIVYA